MGRKQPTFTQRDVVRAIKASVAAGIKVARIEIQPDGVIRVYCDVEQATGPDLHLDQWMAKHARSA